MFNIKYFEDSPEEEVEPEKLPYNWQFGLPILTIAIAITAVMLLFNY